MSTGLTASLVACALGVFLISGFIPGLWERTPLLPSDKPSDSSFGTKGQRDADAEADARALEKIMEGRGRPGAGNNESARGGFGQSRSPKRGEAGSGGAADPQSPRASDGKDVGIKPTGGPALDATGSGRTPAPTSSPQPAAGH